MRGVRRSRDRLRESVEQRSLREILRMPLDRNDPRLIRVRRLDALDDTIVGPRDGLESRRQIANRLMVPAVHRGQARAERSFQERSRLDAHRMAEGFVAVRHGAWPLATQILVERAAKGDVENLNSTADRENGHAARARDRDERHLRRIAYGIDSTEAGMRRRPVTIGSDV